VNQTSNKYDLEERTAKFSESMISFCKSLSHTPLSLPLITQLIRSTTSIGANYMEANGASSKKDFQNKCFICKKEASETKYWLRLLVSYYPERRDELTKLWKEAQELTLIFQKITSTIRNS
jgi:four helix bundle protein